MPISVKDENYKNIEVIRGIGTNAIQVIMSDFRTFRIYAGHNILSGSTPKYSAIYDELVETTIGGETKRVWVEAPYPWQEEDTIEECLRRALLSVDMGERREHRPAK